MFVKPLTPDSIVIGAPAKVNLFLEVLQRRPDGFHEINSLFQAVSLFDRLVFKKKTDPGISLTINQPGLIPDDDNNLIAKAYRAVASRHDLPSGLEVGVEKNIPVSAGLGGGSSDAAATILAAKLLFDLPLDRYEMAEIGLEVGSDVPFFFGTGQALVSGRGEILTDSEFPTDYWLVLVTPDLAVSTAEAYAELRRGLTKPKEPFSLRRCETMEAFIASLSESGNDFEAGHLKRYPALTSIFALLSKRGAVLTRMSGSGPTCFGLFKNAPEIVKDNKSGWESWQVAIVRPISLPGN